MRTVNASASLLILISLAAACSGSETPPPAATACTPGMSIACTGPGGCSGAQACKGDGSGYDSCDCGGGTDAGADTTVADAMTGDVAVDSMLATDATTSVDTAIDSFIADTSDAATTEVAADSSLDGSATDTGGTMETGGTDPGCAGIPSTATDVYVDGSVTTTGKGGKSCPFKTILEALDAPLGTGVKRTVWVAAGSYLETNVIALKKGMTLRGAGTSKTTVKAKGTCPETYTNRFGAERVPTLCAIYMPQDAIVQDLAVQTLYSGEPSPVGIVMGSDGGTKVSNIDFSAYDAGIFARGPADIVNVHGVSVGGATNSLIEGLALGTVHVRSEGSGTTLLEKAGAYGIVATGYTTMDVSGITIREGGYGGMYLSTLSSSSSPPRRHTISNSNISNNGLTRSDGFGIQVNDGSLTLRGTTILGHTQYGLKINFTGSNFLDLGTTADPGNNIFSSATTSKRNACAAVIMGSTGASGSIPGVGNTWTVCPPYQNTASASCVYSDILYTGAALSPINTASCTAAM